ncbi:M23 family metallopeptidase [Blastomonas marina]|uniref:M23 family metallopeptidase n=1 Tax=Blastomonas marina TaxID=1867408 RepID=UPI002AC92AB8|nr:M23 family metallopeptidase [Blastomonas marina]WPZ03483.1 M23 family metallopeptidase [Blastomonas marina]
MFKPVPEHEATGTARGGAPTLGIAMAIDESADAKREFSLPGPRALAERYEAWRVATGEKLARFDLAPDLGSNIGSRKWLRGAASLIGLAVLAFSLGPDIDPISAAAPAAIDDVARDEYRSMMIMPLAEGGESGRVTGASLSVTALPNTPERPTIERSLTMPRGAGLAGLLRRAGLQDGEANRAEDLVAGIMPLSDIAAGTQLDLTLGRRAKPGAPRPLENLTFRARFDLILELQRGEDGALALVQRPIAVDKTPLRIRGTVGEGLYRAARAAGAPTRAIRDYLRLMGGRVSLNSEVGAEDTFDMVFEYSRAATGETQLGRLLYAGLERTNGKDIALVRYGSQDKFFDSDGKGEITGGLSRPTSGRQTSGYGMRRHPILGYRRMHGGLDFGGGYGAPIYAVTDGRVRFSGRNGGYGNQVRLSHPNGLSSSYSHMSRATVRSGQQVKRGQVIGYIGSTGLSTGPHLHYELFQGGRRVDPRSVKYVQQETLGGRQLDDMRREMASLKQVEPGAALEDFAAANPVQDAPQREIDRIGAAE